MTKLILALLLAIMPAMAAEEAVEQYSDEKPKLFLYSEGDFPPKKELLIPQEYSPVHEIRSYGKNCNDIYSLRLPDTENNGHALVIRNTFKKKAFEVSTIMESTNVSVCRSFFSPDKWGIPRHVSPYEGDIINVHPLSWYHVDVLFHSSPLLPYNQSDFSPNPKLDNLYQVISSQGLPSIISRWIITRDEQKYHVYFVYNNDKELEHIPALKLSIF